MDCGSGKALKFAEIVAATVVAGETVARLGDRPPDEWVPRTTSTAATASRQQSRSSCLQGVTSRSGPWTQALRGRLIGHERRDEHLRLPMSLSGVNVSGLATTSRPASSASTG